ncbi:unnamed protein product [Paramecium sonneborni]|uniref:Uncharacterized protein n=1 Tax=Paramecium sonneborni TaxID=65129 RepID=A0A8S1R9P2_9CILI|nr:unnamed protein product [Paramecium sonneborni]
MKYLILSLFVLNVYSFSLNDDWDGMEEAVKVQQDAVLDLVDQLDLYSETPITQQIENQVQQLMNPQSESDQEVKAEDQSEEIHSLEYWLERLGDEYQDETILLQQQQQSQQQQSITEQITTVVGNLVLKVGDANQLKQIAEQTDIASPLIIDGIELEYQNNQDINQNIQMQQLLSSALEMQKSLNQEDQLQQNDLKKKHKKKRPIIDIDFNDLTISEEDNDQINTDNLSSQSNQNNDNTIEVQINSINENEQSSNDSISKFTPNEDTINQVQDNTRMFNFLNDVHDDSLNLNQPKQQVQQSYNYKEYSFNKLDQDPRSFYNDNEDSTVKVLEREQIRDSNNNLDNDKQQSQIQQQQQYSKSSINTKDTTQNKETDQTLQNQDQQQETSILKKYLLYTDQPEVISTGTTDKEIEDDKRLVTAFKSMNRDEHWIINNKKQKDDKDFRNELLTFSNVNEQSEQKEQKIPQFKEVTDKQVENPHKFISFKPDPEFEKAENSKKDQDIKSKQDQNSKSKYDELPETKLQSKEEMKKEKQQKIQEMQRIIEEQLKNKTLKKKSDSDKSLQYESEYLQWERATQAKSYPTEINFVMTKNNLRKRL